MPVHYAPFNNPSDGEQVGRKELNLSGSANKYQKYIFNNWYKRENKNPQLVPWKIVMLDLNYLLLLKMDKINYLETWDLLIN